MLRYEAPSGEILYQLDMTSRTTAHTSETFHKDDEDLRQEEAKEKAKEHLRAQFREAYIQTLRRLHALCGDSVKGAS